MTKAEVYKINVAAFMELASDRELKALVVHNKSTDHSPPGEHLENATPLKLAKIF